MSGERTGRGTANSSNEPLFFVEHSTRGSSSQRRVVRTRAALASASSRKVTIATRAERQSEESAQEYTPRTWSQEEQRPGLTERDNESNQGTRSNRISEDAVVQQLARHLSQLQLAQSLPSASLSHRAVRNALWAGMVISTELFQAALFISSTWHNSTGLPISRRNQNLSQILLKVGSMQIVNAAIASPAAGSLTPFAVAMLASWERQHGDREEHEVHMRGWRSLPIPSEVLDETKIANLSDLALGAFRQALDERAMTTPIGSRNRSATSYHVLLPLGFWNFHVGRPESRSLLDIVSHLTRHDPRAPDSVVQIRRLGLEVSAWTPYHTHGLSPVPAAEDSWDQEELNALYHVRAVSLQIAGMLLRASITAHGISWPWNEREALATHTRCCKDMQTEQLLGTKFQEVAVWSRFVMCAVSRDEERDAFMRNVLLRLNLRTWNHMQAMLQRHVYVEWLHGRSCRGYFELLMMQGVRTPG